MTIDNEYIEKRREKVKLLRELKIDPYTNIFRPTVTVKEINDKYKNQDKSSFKSDNINYNIAGRVVAIRSFGKSAFIKIIDNQNKFQIFISNDTAGKEKMDFFKKFVDIGDFIGIVGPCFFTKTNELSIEANDLIMLTKSLNSLPEKWHGLTNVETRYRQRYVDLIANESVKEIFLLRSKIINQIRNFMSSKDFTEVETPLLHNVAGGAAAKPFRTHHNTLDMELILRIAPELYLKRLVIGGIEKVFEIGRNFRNEGISTQHNPEFTMIELYQAYSDYQEMMNFIEELILDCVKLISKNKKINYQDNVIDFKGPWERVHMIEWLSKDLGFDVLSEEKKILSEADKMKINHFEIPGRAITEIFETKFFQNHINPVFVYGFPIDVSPLARRNNEDNRIADRFELFINEKEIANAFSELNDPDDQLERFEQQMKQKEKGDEEANDMDEDYINALRYGMPPTVGAGIGIDRLVMLLTNSASIRDVILFPHMRNE
ncbi:MAG: lysine--tRNA ligase [Thermodesulfobacteriota bacterium]|nr:lysine--tRNA ligase [Thermodesulfobacteriota bacterium]|tara:strand:- start:5588 stop:7057 length:1470 start_codon:yes stop_codon:yes gene_type:complete